VEIVTRGVVAVTRRPKPDFDTMNDLYHAEHEWISRVSPIEGARRGASGFREWLLDIEETADLDMRLMEVEAMDEDRVLYVLSIRFRGKSSGVDLGEQEMASIATVRGGKIVRTESYTSRAEATAAAGLIE
jgi:ketosteroid isomerase-like protein